MNIDWTSEKSHILLNPALPTQTQSFLEKAVDEKSRFAGQIWLLSSGTTANENEFKLVALSKRALICSAKEVNRHIEATESDTWFNVLPLFHVGGLSILVRAFLSGASVVNGRIKKWSVTAFCQQLAESNSTLVSLVPTQVYDIVRSKINCPKKLRVAFVGGGSLSLELINEAKKLGWPLLPTYGMTEACSQVATALLPSIDIFDVPQLHVLPHWQTKVDEETQQLLLKGPSLLSAYLSINSQQTTLYPHSPNEWFVTQDRVVLNKNIVSFLGRKGAKRKVLGELVDLNELQSKWNSLALKANLAPSASVLLAIPDSRKENSVVVVFEKSNFEQIQACVDCFNQSVLPYEKITHIYRVEDLPKTELGKISIKKTEQRIR